MMLMSWVILSANIASCQTAPYRNRTACPRFASHTRACHTPEHEKLGEVLHKGTHSCILKARSPRTISFPDYSASCMVGKGQCTGRGQTGHILPCRSWSLGFRQNNPLPYRPEKSLSVCPDDLPVLFIKIMFFPALSVRLQKQTQG